eukprot:s3327_g2.t1
MRFYGLLPLLWLSQAARDAEDFELIGSPEESEEDQQSSFAQRTFGHGKMRHHRLEDDFRRSRLRRLRCPRQKPLRKRTRPKMRNGSRFSPRPRRTYAMPTSFGMIEPDDCGPLLGNQPAEVRAQVLRCLKQRKRQAGKVQETLQNRLGPKSLGDFSTTNNQLETSMPGRKEFVSRLGPTGIFHRYAQQIPQLTEGQVIQEADGLVFVVQPFCKLGTT